MNTTMWRKALNVIPNVSREEWTHLDFVSKWLISTRAAVLVMTLISAMLAGFFAVRDSSFHFIPWISPLKIQYEQFLQFCSLYFVIQSKRIIKIRGGQILR